MGFTESEMMRNACFTKITLSGEAILRKHQVLEIRFRRRFLKRCFGEHEGLGFHVFWVAERSAGIFPAKLRAEE
jgi:hypothetical protein